MNLNIIFNKCIPESTFPLNGVKLVKKKYSNEAIERRKEKFAIIEKEGFVGLSYEKAVSLVEEQNQNERKTQFLSLFGESQPNCTDDLPPGSFVTLDVVLFPSIKTFWFSFIPYMLLCLLKRKCL